MKELIEKYEELVNVLMTFVPGLQNDDCNRLKQEISALKAKQEEGYPAEFIRWLSIKIKSLDIKLGLPVMYRYNDKTYTLPELLTYWKTK